MSSAGLYIEPNNNGTWHRLFKIKTKSLLKTPKIKLKPIPQYLIDLANILGKEEGVPGGRREKEDE